MGDQASLDWCSHCGCKGNLKECLDTHCVMHTAWIVWVLKQASNHTTAELAGKWCALRAENEELRNRLEVATVPLWKRFLRRHTGLYSFLLTVGRKKPIDYSKITGMCESGRLWNRCYRYDNCSYAKKREECK